MHDLHITRQLLRAIQEGKRNPGDLAKVAMAHLFQSCEVCRAEYDGWVAEVKASGEAVASDYGEMVERVLGETEAMAEAVAGERRQAATRLESLLALPAGERLAAIEAEPSAFRGLALGELLIEASLAQMPGRPRQALALGELAMALLHHGDLSPYRIDLYARATAHVANALRVGGQLQRPRSSSATPASCCAAKGAAIPGRARNWIGWRGVCAATNDGSTRQRPCYTGPSSLTAWNRTRSERRER